MSKLSVANPILFVLCALVCVGLTETTATTCCRACETSCVPLSADRELEYKKQYEELLRNDPELQKKATEVELTHTTPTIRPIPCNCNSTPCYAQVEMMTTCDDCIIVWPHTGVPNTVCSHPFSFCHLGCECGCSGKCQEYGGAKVKVCVYCPGPVKGEFTIEWRVVTVCTNCCCQFGQHC